MIDLRATARLQLHAGFTLHDALAQLPYYAGLGISHLYLSPIGTAVPAPRTATTTSTRPWSIPNSAAKMR